jgi:hypothetical protein
MCAWHDKWNALFKQNISQECQLRLALLSFYLLSSGYVFIYIRQIDTPTWCLFYFAGPALSSDVAIVRSLDLRGVSVVTGIRSLDLFTALASSSVNFSVSPASLALGR